MRSRPSIADLPAFLRDPRGLFTRVAGEPGDVAALRLGRRTLLVKRPADAAHVLARNYSSYEKTPRLTRGGGRRAAGEGVFTAPSTEALAHRRPVQPLFGRRALVALEPVIERCVAERVERWPGGAPSDLGREAHLLAEELSIATVFGAEAPADLRAGMALRRRRLTRALEAPVPLPAAVPLALSPGARATLRRSDAALAETIAARRAEPGPDLVSALAASDLSDAELREEALSLALAGVEAVARGLAAAIDTIGSDPVAAAAVREETEAERRSGADARTRLAFTDRAVMEALRLHPPTTFIVRIAQAPDRLPSGAEVERGAKVLVAPYVLHTDPALYPDPRRFDPARFTPEARRARERFAYIPFGAGPRTCIARNLAMVQLVLAVGAVLCRAPSNPTYTRSP